MSDPPDVHLEVSVSVVAALFEEGVHLLVADLLQPRRGDHVPGLLADAVAVVEGRSDAHVRV